MNICDECKNRGLCTAPCPELDALLREENEGQDRDLPTFEPREIEVFRLIADGVSREKICHDLRITRSNLKTIISNLRSKSRVILKNQDALFNVRLTEAPKGLSIRDRQTINGKEFWILDKKTGKKIKETI